MRDLYVIDGVNQRIKTNFCIHSFIIYVTVPILGSVHIYAKERKTRRRSRRSSLPPRHTIVLVDCGGGGMTPPPITHPRTTPILGDTLAGIEFSEDSILDQRFLFWLRHLLWHVSKAGVDVLMPLTQGKNLFYKVNILLDIYFAKWVILKLVQLIS